MYDQRSNMSPSWIHLVGYKVGSVLDVIVWLASWLATYGNVLCTLFFFLLFFSFAFVPSSGVKTLIVPEVVG